MSGLLIRHDPAEKVFRSVGDPPNGIIGLGFPEDRAALYVDPQFQPVAIEPGTVNIAVHASPTGLPEGAAALTAEEVIEACEDTEIAQGLYFMVAKSAQIVFDHYVGAGALESYRTFFDLLIELRDAGEARWAA